MAAGRPLRGPVGRRLVSGCMSAGFASLRLGGGFGDLPLGFRGRRATFGIGLDTILDLEGFGLDG